MSNSAVNTKKYKINNKTTCKLHQSVYNLQHTQRNGLNEMTTKKELETENNELKLKIESMANKAGTNISNCSITMNLEAEEATKTLAEAMLEQAKANQDLSRAILGLADSLKPADACAIKIINE